MRIQIQDRPRTLSWKRNVEFLNNQKKNCTYQDYKYQAEQNTHSECVYLWFKQNTNMPIE